MLDHRAIDRLFETIGRDAESLVEMIDSFLEEGPLLIRQMSEAALSQDFALMCRAAHSLKSNARDFGATHLAHQCAGIEDDLRAGQAPPDALARADQVAACWTTVEAALRQLAFDTGRSA